MFKKILLSLKEVLVVSIIQLLIIFFSSLICSLISTNSLEKFTNNYLPYIVIITDIIIILVLLKKYKIKLGLGNIKTYPTYILFGLSLAINLNMILFLIKPNSLTTSMPLMLVILSTGIIGPILEEILFRYLLLGNLLKITTRTKAILIETSVFALMHGSFLNIIYAFIVGYFLSKIYLKHNNITFNIITHMSANIIVIFILNFNIYIFIISIISLIISYILIFRGKLWVK